MKPSELESLIADVAAVLPKKHQHKFIAAAQNILASNLGASKDLAILLTCLIWAAMKAPGTPAAEAISAAVASAVRRALENLKIPAQNTRPESGSSLVQRLDITPVNAKNDPLYHYIAGRVKLALSTEIGNAFLQFKTDERRLRRRQSVSLMAVTLSALLLGALVIWGGYTSASNVGYARAHAEAVAEMPPPTSAPPTSAPPTSAPPTPSQTTEVDRTSFRPDPGDGCRHKDNYGLDTMRAVTKEASHRLIWVTSSPDNRTVLSHLAGAKKDRSVKVLIVTGAETTEKAVASAEEFGFKVARLKVQLCDPYSLLISDSSNIVDLSRNPWFWKSEEPHVVEETVNWIKGLLAE